MNAPLRPEPQAAFSPAVFTDDEFENLLGVPEFARLGRFELRDGVIYRMNAQFAPHTRVKMMLAYALEAAVVKAGLDLEVMSEGSVRFGAGFMPLPDVFVWEPADVKKAFPGDRVKLAVEVSNTTFNDDFGDKLPRYARAGVAEYWIVEVPKRKLHLFAAPKARDYQRKAAAAFGDQVQALTLPELIVDTSRLARL